MGKPIKIVFGTDFHGSEVCFRKVFTLAERARADVVALGGDVCGKGLVPIVRREGGHRAVLGGVELVATTDRELEEIETRIRSNGLYPFVCEPDELERMSRDPELVDERFRAEMVATVERWLAIASDRLSSDQLCFSLPGNDDDWAIDPALEASTRVPNCDGRVVDLGVMQVIGFGSSNRTPWNSPREMDEEDIYARLSAIAEELDPGRPWLANVHVPPFRSTLDNAPKLDERLREVRRAGNPMVAPVGSTAVRRWLEERQPLVSLHGHVHESRSSTRIGQTLAVNPGSDYSAGVLTGAVITVDLAKRVARGPQFVSG
jgi:Icc-related predicted phosphoesterase